MFTANGQTVVGPDPDCVVREQSAQVIQGVKRQMGHPGFTIRHQDRDLNAEFVSACILMKLKQDAERRIGTIGNAVITVPYYFNDACRTATRNAGHIAGLNVVDLINEPTAATLTYAWTQGQLGNLENNSHSQRILVYDLGGGTFDVTVVRCTPTSFEVIATDGDVRLGGMDWTQRLVDHLAVAFRNQHGVDPRENRESELDLREQCEQAKRKLAARHQTPLQISVGRQTLNVRVQRAEFESLTADLLQRTQDTTELVLEAAGVAPNEVDEVLLVGGSTRMPAVFRMLKQLVGKPPSVVLNPQLAVARGAAIHAAILESRDTEGRSASSQALLRRLQSISMVDVNSHSLGLELTDPRDKSLKRNHIMIQRTSRLPCEFRQRFVTTTDNPREIRFRLLEGEASDINACTILGDLLIGRLPSNLPAGSPVEVAYSYDINRCVHVTAKELTGNRSATVTLDFNGAIDPKQLESFRELASRYRVS